MLQHKIRIKTANIPSLVLSCFILHNASKYLGDEEFPDPERLDDVVDPNLDDQQLLNGREDNDRITRLRGEMKRSEIADAIYELCDHN